jgi:hypothetical protein
MLAWLKRLLGGVPHQRLSLSDDAGDCTTPAKLVKIRMAKITCPKCGAPFSDGDLALQLFGAAGETLIHDKCATPEQLKEAACSL